MDLSQPFRGTEALAAGVVTRRTLASRHRRIFRDVYIHPATERTPIVMAHAAWLFADRRAVLGGESAAALHGTEWLDPNSPPELIRADIGCPGMVVHRYNVRPDEVCAVRGMPVTTPARTAFDLGRRRNFTRSVIQLDALAHATRLVAADVELLIGRHHGARGIVQLRKAVAVMDGGAESPPETRTRLALLDGGLRRPTTQIVVYDDGGYPFARIDMGYEEFRVGVEYDGIQHWTDPKCRAHDIERQRELDAMGWQIIHVSSDMLRHRPWVIVNRTEQALRAAGCPWVDDCGVLPRRPPRRVS